jgi:hypothetical protein
LTGSSALLTALAVIAAGLLAGCADKVVGTVDWDSNSLVVPADRGSRQILAQSAPAPPTSSRDVKRRLARLALDESSLSTVRGGYDLGAGVTMNFAFQQATYVNHNLAQSVVIPTLTISPGQAGGPVAVGGIMPPSISSATVVANGTVQSQVSVANSPLQALVNSGMATIVGGSNGGVITTLSNTANNQLIQQMTTVDIGVTGLSKMLQQNVASLVLSRIAGPNAFR